MFVGGAFKNHKPPVAPPNPSTSEGQESSITDIYDFVAEGVEEKLLHIDLTDIDDDRIKIKYFWSETDSIINGERSLSQLAELRQQNYPENLGNSLYNWLNLPDKVINLMNQQQGIILAIALPDQLSKYNWESLHLVNKKIVPIRWFKQSREPVSPKDRPLNVLFMAAEPEGSESQIDFEQQELKILEATKGFAINLVIEESGSLDGLLFTSQLCFPGNAESDNLDILHLAADVRRNCLLTEDEYGNPCESNAKKIMDCFNETFPQLIFLSTPSSNREMTSLASDFIQRQANLVLTVNAQDSEEVISVVYKELASGRTLKTTIFNIYEKIYEKDYENEPKLHSLKLYLADTSKLSEHLVLPGQVYTRHKLKKEKFGENAEVATREDFVGRRRQLQNCLKALKIESKVGVLIQGMGGLGKSSIAFRMISDRLPDYKPIIWSRWTEGNKKEKKEPLNENKLLEKIRKDHLSGLEFRYLYEYLKEGDKLLQENLTLVFEELQKKGKLLILIFDDFEWNLEPEENKYKIMSEPARVLQAVVKAIENSKTPHKIIITCRYKFDADILSSFYSQGLEAFSDSDLQKKLRKLEKFNSDNISEALIGRALNLADGNPRLLEFLNDDILGQKDVEAELKKLEQSPEEWKDKIIWKELYQLIDEPLQQVLSYCLVYELRVPMVALEAVCDSLPNYQREHPILANLLSKLTRLLGFQSIIESVMGKNRMLPYQQHLRRGLDLGLIEMSPEPTESNRVYRVSRILPHIIHPIHPIGLPKAPQVYSLYRKAHKELHNLWGNQENKSEERWREIFRLLFADRNNPQRFREGFSKMLKVQYNSEAVKAFESELRLNNPELSEENSYAQLRDYLSKDDWKEADKETAYLFYVVMVEQGYQDWYELCREFPSEILNEIDKLWVNYSNNKFGFSIQKRIWSSLGGSTDSDDFQQLGTEEEQWSQFLRRYGPQQGVWEQLGQQVGWYADVDQMRQEFLESPDREGYNSLSFSTESPDGQLPALVFTKQERYYPDDQSRNETIWLSGYDKSVGGLFFTRILLWHPDLT